MTNKITKLFNIQYPIILGGMGNISSSSLAAAVSNSGGLGTIGCGTMSADQIEELIIETKKLTNKPFAVNIPINVTSHIDQLIDMIIKYEVPIVSLSAGNPAPYISTLKSNGIKVITIVGAIEHAVKAESAGADAVVAEGFEAAGINSPLELTTMTLIPQIVDAVNIPVIAAGGIGSGKGLAAALMLGADGVQMGTRFVATKEAPFHNNYKQAMLKATDHTTQIIGRSVGRTRRVMPGQYVDQILKEEQAHISTEKFDLLTNEDKHIQGAIKGDFASGYVNGGQVSGLIDSIPSTKTLIESMIKEAKQQIENVHTNFDFL